ncbi:hypothetical protein [Clostridium sp. HBUAS56010]|uniref:hypothetical protein n=1 Tax=Clostridium sp. HBUAS56010 TaxID=2571127 RepID=UPI0011782AF1|nr:hypothetical protein [Clostridium sp. HBUAS56010]
MVLELKIKNKKEVIDMASTNKTSLGLNMWEASDKPVRMDFVNDNSIINEEVSNLKEDLGKSNALVDEKISKLNSNLTNVTTGDTLLGKIKYLPEAYIDNPNSYFNLSGWNVIPYLTFANVSPDIGWGLIVGTLDNNNGNPVGAQFAVGTVQIAYRKYATLTWSDWTFK